MKCFFPDKNIKDLMQNMVEYLRLSQDEEYSKNIILELQV